MSLVREIKLRHLKELLKPKPDYSILMIEVAGFKNTWLGRKRFVKKYKEVFEAGEELKQLLPQDMKVSEECPIKAPRNIDSITFRQMIELQQLMSKGADMEITELMSIMITTACLPVSNARPYDSESNAWKNYRRRVEECSAIDMLALFNIITQQLVESSKVWDERFQSVDVPDEDYVKAGGPDRMRQFNVTNTIRKLCQAYNCSRDEAWQVPYIYSQMLSYSDASAAYTQHQMSEYKRLQMLSERQRKRTH